MNVKPQPLATNGTIGVIATDRHGMITVFNHGAEQLLGHQSKTLVGKKTSSVFHSSPTKSSWHSDLLQQLATDNAKRTYQWIFLHQAGHKVPVTVHLSVIYNTEQIANGLLWMILPEQASHSSLPNRAAFETVVATEIKRMQRHQAAIGVMLISIDHFAAYRDHYGVKKSEQLIQEVTTILSQRIRRAGDSLSYYDQALFAVCLPDTQAPGTAKLAEILRLLVADREIMHGAAPNEAFVTLSIGIDCRPASQTLQCSTLLHAAQQALTKAQQDGGHCSRIYQT